MNTLKVNWSSNSVWVRCISENKKSIIGFYTFSLVHIYTFFFKSSEKQNSCHLINWFLKEMISIYLKTISNIAALNDDQYSFPNFVNVNSVYCRFLILASIQFCDWTILHQYCIEYKISYAYFFLIVTSNLHLFEK